MTGIRVSAKQRTLRFTLKAATHHHFTGVAARRADPRRLRRIVLLPLGLSDADLAVLTEVGLIGLWFDVPFDSGFGFEVFDAFGAPARELG